MLLTELRREYTQHGLSEDEVDRDPLRQFHRWLDEAVKAGITEPNAMTLATVDPTGRPSARIVLLRGCDERGFTFFTSYRGRKADDLRANANGALVFYWADLERQVRVEGTVDVTTVEESDEYFAGRPRGSQLGAWASHQSQAIPDRTALEARMAEYTTQFEGKHVPRPLDWGGYRLLPTRIEFWQGRPSRLHDRLCFERGADGRWVLSRLSP